ncbi:hypothetical protein COL26b_007427 [Colletotrichum chrysophilum]|nr:uncharacterized protein COL26b_007427 [Colletotrichum chrysophilum]KAJ0374347.1 hypothetical protein COL26b_007427 [Colletotrichum chrysophilum]
MQEDLGGLCTRQEYDRQRIDDKFDRLAASNAHELKALKKHFGDQLVRLQEVDNVLQRRLKGVIDRQDLMESVLAALPQKHHMLFGGFAMVVPIRISARHTETQLRMASRPQDAVPVQGAPGIQARREEQTHATENIPESAIEYEVYEIEMSASEFALLNALLQREAAQSAAFNATNHPHTYLGPQPDVVDAWMNQIDLIRCEQAMEIAAINTLDDNLKSLERDLRNLEEGMKQLQRWFSLEQRIRIIMQTMFFATWFTVFVLAAFAVGRKL